MTVWWLCYIMICLIAIKKRTNLSQVNSLLHSAHASFVVKSNLSSFLRKEISINNKTSNELSEHLLLCNDHAQISEYTANIYRINPNYVFTVHRNENNAHLEFRQCSTTARTAYHFLCIRNDNTNAYLLIY